MTEKDDQRSIEVEFDFNEAQEKIVEAVLENGRMQERERILNWIYEHSSTDEHMNWHRDHFDSRDLIRFINGE